MCWAFCAATAWCDVGSSDPCRIVSRPVFATPHARSHPRHQEFKHRMRKLLQDDAQGEAEEGWTRV